MGYTYRGAQPYIPEPARPEPSAPYTPTHQALAYRAYHLHAKPAQPEPKYGGTVGLKLAAWEAGNAGRAE